MLDRHHLGRHCNTDLLHHWSALPVARIFGTGIVGTLSVPVPVSTTSTTRAERPGFDLLELVVPYLAGACRLISTFSAGVLLVPDLAAKPPGLAVFAVLVLRRLVGDLGDGDLLWHVLLAAEVLAVRVLLVVGVVGDVCCVGLAIALAAVLPRFAKTSVLDDGGLLEFA